MQIELISPKVPDNRWIICQPVLVEHKDNPAEQAIAIMLVDDVVYFNLEDGAIRWGKKQGAIDNYRIIRTLGEGDVLNLKF